MYAGAYELLTGSRKNQQIKKQTPHKAKRRKHAPTALSCYNYLVVGPTLAWDYTDSGPLHVQRFKANNEVGLNWQRSVVCIQPPAPPLSLAGAALCVGTVLCPPPL